MENYDLKKVLTNLGISTNDVIMVHGDAGVAAQLRNIAINERINYLLNELINFIGSEGTLVVPTFSYTFTKNENFDPINTPSDVGVFSEAFRVHPGTLRSKNPNFSVSSIGKYAEKFSESRIDDCFGPKTAFDILYNHNAKLLCLGCNFSRITFVHYVEQKLGVSYRYLKSFSGHIIDGNNSYDLVNTYYVRDLSIDSQGELTAVKELAEKKGLLGTERFGRFPVISICSKDFYDISKELITRDPYALTKHRLSLK